MGSRKPRTRLKPGLKKHSQMFSILESNPPTSIFAKSELGEFLSNKIILRKYLAILKRKVNNGVTLNDLDSLQLELEALLLSSIKRGQILRKEHSVLEKELEISDPKTIILKGTTIPYNVQQNAPIAILGPSSIKFIIPRLAVSKRVPTKKQRLSRKEDELVPQLTVNKFPEEIKPQVNTSSSLTTYSSELDTATSCKTRSTKPNNKNFPSAILIGPPLAISHSLPLAISHSPPLAISNSPPLAISHSPPLAISHSPPLTISNSPPLAVSNNPPLAVSNSPPTAISSSPTAISSGLQGLEQGNSLERDLGLVAKNSLCKSEPKQNLREAKTKRVLKPEKSGRNSNARIRKKDSVVRYLEPSKKFWQSLTHIIRSISEADIKYLEDVLKNQETMEKSLKEPLVMGSLFASRWANSELTEEKVFASETPMPRKASIPMPKDIPCMMKRAEIWTDREKGSLRCSEPDPLCSQILSALKDGNIITVAEQETKCVKVLQSVNEEDNFYNNSDMEKAIRIDLVKAGIISDKNIVRADTTQEAEIDVKLKLAKNRFRALTKLSICELKRVIKLAKQQVCKQNLNKKLISKGKEIEKVYQNILTQKRKGEPTAKHIKKAMKLVLDRETILSKLKNLNQA